MKRLTAVTLLSMPLLYASTTDAQAVKPNFVIILGDDCGYRDLNIYGSRNTLTPNITALAREGMTFNNCFQSAAMSSPTRHALYTGVFPVRSGAYPNHTFCNDTIKSFVQYFKPNGYRTALYGKQHVAPKSVFSYDFLGDYTRGAMDFNLLQTYINHDKSSPFFLVVASNEPHSPWRDGDRSQWDPKTVILPPYLVDTRETRQEYVAYLAEVELLDQQVGNLVKVLKETGKYANTVFIFLSEQGHSFPFSKWTLYNEGLHSAMIVVYPDVVAPNSVSDALVDYVDVMPTLLDFASIKADNSKMDGTSFKNVLLQKTDEHRKYVFGIQTTRGIIDGSEYYGIRSAATKRYRYIRNLTPEMRFSCYASNPANSPTWKSWLEMAKTDSFAAQQVSRYQYRPAEELYDLCDDPLEFNNLAADPAYSKIKTELSRQLDNWMLQQGDKGQETELKADERHRRLAPR